MPEFTARTGAESYTRGMLDRRRPAQITIRTVGRIELKETDSETCIVTLVGDHDLSTAAHVRSVLKEATDGAPGVVVDLSETTFLDSSILHVLIDADTELRNRHRGLRLSFGDAGAIRRVFEVAGLLDRFDQVKSLDDPTGT